MSFKQSEVKKQLGALPKIWIGLLLF